ncbi:unnamed protein product [Lactuca virosa]|uniref:J domain-containing protein n=1 Tax=Lactuca virosa TaxID=75947 RepID=A0AAU9PJA8_9ASTR|nr:unnamed protein product [Lactuca virosa]
MERKRDEAIRAKRLVEKKLADKDFAASKKYTVKAQTMCPDLDGISQMSTIVDVYISAENKLNGEVDWYGILGVNPCDDDETIRKQYRKLALMLNPDKNKSVGEDGAFKLISEAWSLLSDKAKRSTYNQRTKVPSASPGAGVNSFAKRATSKVQKSHSSTTTFWIVCHGCRMQYEYLKIYLNQTLLCPNCQEPFLAKESAPPVTFKKSVSHQHQQHQDSMKQYHSSNNTNTDSFCNTDPSIASQAANVIQRVNERLKIEREEFSMGNHSKNRKADEKI